MDYGKHLNAAKTPQTKPIFGKAMVKNEAGGFGFKKDWHQRLLNFLILGSEGGTYYVGERELTLEHAQHLMELAQDKEKGMIMVAEIVSTSVHGLAPKNDPAIFALAVACAHGEPLVKETARANIPSVCRIGTHLFTFMQNYKDVGGKTSRSMKRAIANFYTKKEPQALALQLIKYRQRNGWTHRDVLRLCHAPGKPGMPLQNLLRFAAGKPFEGEPHPLVGAYQRISEEKDAKRAAKIIVDHKLPWEAVPTDLLKEKIVWDALLPNMGYTALIRNLGKLSSLGFFGSRLDEDTKSVSDRLLNQESLIKGRVHPFQILLAYSTYRQGHGVKGSLSWSVNDRIADALDQAFFLAFRAVQPTNKNIVVGVDVSGSMGATVNNTHLSAAEAAFVMALIHMRTEPNCDVIAFDTEAKPLAIPGRASLAEYLRIAKGFHGGGTDCSAPIRAVMKSKFNADAFVIYTDSGTWAGAQHPCQVFKEYKEKKNAGAKCIGVEMASTSSTIADPTEPGMLSISGMDASVPQVVRNFIQPEAQQ